MLLQGGGSNGSRGAELPGPLTFTTDSAYFYHTVSYTHIRATKVWSCASNADVLYFRACLDRREYSMPERWYCAVKLPSFDTRLRTHISHT